MKKSKSLVKPNPELFKNSLCGRLGYKPLQHKDGTIFDDIDYFELLGRKCIEMDKTNATPYLPTDYGTFDRATCDVAKQVCKALDEGMSKQDINKFLAQCINIEE